MTCYFAEDITRLPGGLQLGDKGFSHTVVCQLHICDQTRSHGFHYSTNSILAHSSFCVPQLRIILDDGYWTDIAGRCLFDNHNLKTRTASLSSPSVLNISSDVDLRLICRLPLRVFVGPSLNSTTSLPSCCCLMIKPLHMNHSAPGNCVDLVAREGF